MDLPIRMQELAALALTALAACGKPTGAPPNVESPSRSAQKPADNAAAPPTSGWLHAVGSDRFLAGEARVLSDGGLEVRIKNQPWERLAGIDDARAVAGNRDVGCVLRQGGTVTCWTGTQWREHIWIPPRLTGVTEILARPDDVCARTAAELICFRPPAVLNSHALKRRARRQELRERRGESVAPQTSAPSAPEPKFEVMALSEAARIVPKIGGRPGVITPSGTFQHELGGSPDPVEGMPAVVAAVYGPSRRGFAARDKAGALYVSDRGEPPHVDSRLAGVVELVASQERDREVGTVYARTSAGAVWCWGANDLGQCGDGTWGSENTSEAKKLDLPPVTALFVDQAWVCAETEDDGVWCWGDSRRTVGRTPSDGVVQLDTPMVDAIASDGESMLCVLRSREVSCSTEPGAGRLFPAELHAASRLFTIREDICAETPEGVFCWSAQSGLVEVDPDSYADRPRPARGSAPKFIHSSVGSELVCGVSPDGKVACGPLGSPRSRYTAVGLPEAATHVAVAYGAGCARLQSGAVACWGAAIDPVTGAPAVWATPTPLGRPPASASAPVGFLRIE